MDKSDKLILTEVKNNIPQEHKWSVITASLFALLGFFWILALVGIIPTDYNIFFFVLSLFTGFFFFKERKTWKPYLRQNQNKEWIRPWWLSWTAGIFPVVVFMFLLRGFVVEPFKVPSGSMIPTIMIGEVTATNKMYYDLKLPILDTKLIHFRNVKRGDVVVFRYPPQPEIYYVKRFIGLPGDTIEYQYATKTLLVNGKKIERTKVQTIEDPASGKIIDEYEEDLMGVKHLIWIDPQSSLEPNPLQVKFDLKNSCQYSYEEVKCKVPQGYYYAMGDNRDNSADSRYWGFVPEKNIIGRDQLKIFSPVSHNRIGWIK